MTDGELLLEVQARLRRAVVNIRALQQQQNGNMNEVIRLGGKLDGLLIALGYVNEAVDRMKNG